MMNIKNTLKAADETKKKTRNRCSSCKGKRKRSTVGGVSLRLRWKERVNKIDHEPGPVCVRLQLTNYFVIVNSHRQSRRNSSVELRRVGRCEIAVK